MRSLLLLAAAPAARAILSDACQIALGEDDFFEAFKASKVAREAATAASLTHDLLLGTIGVLAGLAAWQMLTIASEASVGIASKGFYSKVKEERDGLMRE